MISIGDSPRFLVVRSTSSKNLSAKHGFRPKSTGIVNLSSSRVPHRLQNIIDNAEAIFEYTKGMDLTAFEEDRKTYDAVERCLERIAEAVAKLGDMAPHAKPDQPLRKIRAFGNVLRHEYDAIREDRLFEIVRTDLPSLHASAVEALRRWDLFKLP
jgi:uncharacterized protein with HEPN domain